MKQINQKEKVRNWNIRQKQKNIQKNVIEIETNYEIDKFGFASDNMGTIENTFYWLLT